MAIEAPSRLPAGMTDLLTTNVVAHVTTQKNDGSLKTDVLWIDWDGEHVLVGSAVGSAKGRRLRENANVAISVVDPTDPWRWLSLSGRVVEIRPDENLELIDRQARRYLGSEYPRRTPREVFVIEPETVRASGAGA